MGVKRNELSKAQRAKIAPLLSGKAGDPGRTGSDHRLFVNGCLWVLRSGAHRCDLPERYGRWQTVHRRFSRWCRHAGMKAEAVPPSRRNRQVRIPHNVSIYKHRNQIERCFGRFKHFRRFAR